MSGTRAAIRYAKAILDIASDNNAADAIDADMKTIASTIKGNTELSNFIHNPTLKVEVKENAIMAIFSNVNEITKKLFRLLKENKRFEILDNIAVEYTKLFDEKNGIQIAKVTTAVEMDDVLKAAVLSKIATLTDKKVTVENLVDPSIIGGFILRIGDQQYNASVANRLQILKRELSN